MKALKIIPLFVVFIVLSYFGVLFVEANRDVVALAFANRSTPPAPLGLVVLTSMLAGMLVAAALCSFEIAALFVLNARLKRKLRLLQEAYGADSDKQSRSGSTDDRAHSDIED